jgi:GT2 family glycosyltransferase
MPRQITEVLSLPPPLVSIVIVNWNGKRFLKGCLESVFAHGYNNIEVIFVDNGSTDGSVEFVREYFPQTVVLEIKENLGFAAGNNLGIEVARGEFIATLNNDTELADGFIEKLVEAAEGSGQRVGMWAPKILSMEERDIIDSVGGLLIYPDGLAKGRGRLEKDIGQYDGERDILMPSACAALYRKEMLEEIGLFDEDFFAYCEDTDLGLRARLSGWKAVSVPEAVIYHYYSATGGRYTPTKAYLVERNHFWVAIKNLPPLNLLVSPFYTLWRYLVQLYGIITRSGAGGRFTEEFSSLKLLFMVLKAYGGAIWGLPKMLSKRRMIQSTRKVSAEDVRGWFKTYGISAAGLVLKD